MSIGPTITKAAVERLRERCESARRTFDTILQHQPGTKKLWAEWQAATDPAKKAELYERLRTIALSNPSLGALVVMTEGTIHDFEAAEAALKRMAG